MIEHLIYELSRGMAYRRISHSNMKMYTLWLPLAITALSVIAYIVIPVKPTLIGPSGLTSSMLTLVSTLPGFYFAGLAAVATFGNNEMDKEMPNPAPELKILTSGSSGSSQRAVKLTRRLFLTYLFSYLVLVSFIICFSMIGLNALSGSIVFIQEQLITLTQTKWAWIAVKSIISIPLTFLFSSMIVSTLHGVFFLAEKIHQP